MFATHALVYTVARIGSSAIHFAAIAIYTRLLAPDQYGLWVLSLAAVGLTYSAAFQWIALGLLRFLPKATDREAFLAYIRKLFARICLGLLCIAVLTSIVAAERDLLWQSAILIAALCASHAWVELGCEVARSRLRPDRYAAYSLARGALVLALGATVAVMEGSLTALLVSQIIGNLAVGFVIARCEWAEATSCKQLSIGRALALYAIPLAGVSFSAYLIGASTRFVVAIQIGAAEAGIFSANYDLAWALVTWPITIVHLASYPLIQQLYEQGSPDAVRRAIAKHGELVTLVAVGTATFVSAAAAPIANLILGANFSAHEAHQSFPWIAWSAAIYAIMIFYVGYVFALSQRTGIQLAATLAAAMVNILFALILVDHLGLQGAALATLITYSLLAFLYIVAMRRTKDISVDVWTFIRPGLVGFAAWSALHLMPKTPQPTLAITEVVVAMSAFSLGAILLYGPVVKRRLWNR